MDRFFIDFVLLVSVKVIGRPQTGDSRGHMRSSGCLVSVLSMWPSGIPYFQHANWSITLESSLINNISNEIRIRRSNEERNNKPTNKQNKNWKKKKTKEKREKKGKSTIKWSQLDSCASLYFRDSRSNYFRYNSSYFAPFRTSILIYFLCVRRDNRNSSVRYSNVAKNYIKFCLRATNHSSSLCQILNLSSRFNWIWSSAILVTANPARYCDMLSELRDQSVVGNFQT